MPSIPPILDTPNSRLLYRDLDASATADLLGAGETAWQVVSAAIAESEQGFPDTTFIQVSSFHTCERANGRRHTDRGP
jgi:hypothetical protein